VVDNVRAKRKYAPRMPLLSISGMRERREGGKEEVEEEC